MSRWKCVLWLMLLGFACLALGVQPIWAAGVVTDCSTFGAGAGTLQAALAGGGNVTFACSGTILVPEMVIAADTSINASGQQVILSGNLANRVFNVNAGVRLTLEYVTIANGFASSGAGILNNGGTVTISRSTLLGNQAGNGGGLHNNGGAATVVNSTITQNRAQGTNGGGGGILNSAGSTLTITNSTIAENRAIVGGGIFNAGGTVNLRNSIVAQNLLVANCANTGTFAGSVNNLSDDGTCLGFTVKTAAELKLGTLQSTPAHYPLIIGSAAIDKGNNSICAQPPVSNLDQRGLKRPINATNDLKKAAVCDIGASEWIYPVPTNVPLCADLDGSTNTIVRAVLPTVHHGIHCRLLVENGVFRENSSSIGNAEVLSRTIVQAVDVFSLYNVSAAGSLVCLYGSGGILFLDAAGAPRTPVVLPVVQEDEGYRCIILPNVGILALVTDSSGLPVLEGLVQVEDESAEVSTDTAVTTESPVTELVGCRVTTNHMLNLRAAPSLNAAVLTVLPFELALDATAKSEGWYRVIYGDGQGWVSAGYVTTRGQC